MTNKPGERAIIAMKNMDKAIVPFKVPRVPDARKFQMKILTEEQYVEVSFRRTRPRLILFRFSRFN